MIPKSKSAQGACSLEEPQPKFFPEINIFEKNLKDNKPWIFND